jgi:16S rRNA (cytosine967-C5)-methyltransferase
VQANARRLELTSRLQVVAADATRPPVRAGEADKVLLDAPCSGLGALRRRPDARWRIGEADVAELAALQVRLVEAALPLLRPGGELTYSVCTLTRAESEAIDQHLAEAHPDVEALPAPGAPWRPLGRGAVLLPHDAGTDGMYVLRVRVPGRATGAPAPD